MKYITGEELLAFNARLLDISGGMQGVRDIDLFLSLLERPKTVIGGVEMFKIVFDKAAVYYQSIAKYHVFLDGNKRTSVTVAVFFLHQNGFEFTGTNKDVEEFTLSVVVDRLEIEEIAKWLKKHSKKKQD